MESCQISYKFVPTDGKWLDIIKVCSHWWEVVRYLTSLFPLMESCQISYWLYNVPVPSGQKGPTHYQGKRSHVTIRAKWPTNHQGNRDQLTIRAKCPTDHQGKRDQLTIRGNRMNVVRYLTGCTYWWNWKLSYILSVVPTIGMLPDIFFLF